MRVSQFAILCIAAALAACSPNAVTYTPEEDCAIAGDEDGNGMADCDDPVCTDTPSCPPVCRNGRKERGEGCDDGNSVDGDGCDNNCMATGCGNNVKAGSEECDDGNQASGDGCDNNCTSTRCGNNVTTTGEECDDGDASDTDDCTSSCLLARCGDTFVHAGVESCDDGNTTTEACAYGLTSCMVCDATCNEVAGATSYCGDSVIDATHETCDDGNATTEACAYGTSCTVCGSTCHDAAGATSYCGDSVVDTTHETCDDGNALTDPCPYGATSCTVCGSTCQFVTGPTSYCGDGVVDPTHEECDGGNANNSDVCMSTCMACVATVASDHWKGEYFDNPGLTGSPRIVRDDGVGMIDFNWASGGPNTCGVRIDNFSVRWTRTFSFTAGTWRFTTTTDDGGRVKIDGSPVSELNHWNDQVPTQYTADVTLGAGNHEIVFEYYEHTVSAVAQLSWALSPQVTTRLDVPYSMGSGIRITQ